ncbi:MAG: GNAT family N-acetyltransferase [Flavobacteriales bacterium]
MIDQITTREGEPKDIPAVMKLIRELAIFEKCEDSVAVDENELLRHGFSDHPDYGFYVAEVDGQIVAMAFYYYCFSTWRGRYLYLEDLIVNEAYRQHGVGSVLFEKLVEKTKSEGLRQMGWQVLDWNIPAIKFYKKHGSILDDGWINGRLYFNQ